MHLFLLTIVLPGDVTLYAGDKFLNFVAGDAYVNKKLWMFPSDLVADVGAPRSDDLEIINRVITGGGLARLVTSLVASTKLINVSTCMGDRLQAGKPSWYLASHSRQLSLAIPPWVGAMSTSESWDVNRQTARYTSPVSVVWQCKLVSGWGLMKRRSAPLYGPYGSGRTCFYITLQVSKVADPCLIAKRTMH